MSAIDALKQKYERLLTGNAATHDGYWLDERTVEIVLEVIAADMTFSPQEFERDTNAYRLWVEVPDDGTA